MKTTLLEDNLAGRQPCRKTSSQEDDLTGRQPHRKTVSQENRLIKRQPVMVKRQWPSYLIMTELGTAQPQLVLIMFGNIGFPF